jgi:RimJ/RimL family protein N-acetyltransferase
MLTEEMQDDFFDKVAHDRHSEDRYWEVWERTEAYANVPAGDTFIGLGGLTDIEWENRLAEISLFIKPFLQNRGYGKQAVKLLCVEGFNRMGLQTILGEAFLCNPNWKFWANLTQKFGGYATHLPNRKYWDGKYWDSYYFSWDRGCKWQ